MEGRLGLQELLWVAVKKNTLSCGSQYPPTHIGVYWLAVEELNLSYHDLGIQ